MKKTSFGTARVIVIAVSIVKGAKYIKFFMAFKLQGSKDKYRLCAVRPLASASDKEAADMDSFIGMTARAYGKSPVATLEAQVSDFSSEVVK